MGDAIQRVIENSKVAHMEIFTRNKDEQVAEKQKREQDKKEKSKDPIEGEKLADGFVRSNRNMALRIKEELNNQVAEVEQQKVDLMQKLNHALVKLDKLNSQNREQSNLLVEKIKFVRDLQKATSDGDDVEGIVSTQMKEEFRKEQQINHRLLEEIKRAEMDRQKIMDQIKLLSGEKEITIQTSDGLHKTYKVTQVNINLLLDDLRFLKQTADNKMNQVTQTQQVVRNQEQDLSDLEKLVYDSRHTRDEAGQKTSQVERRWDENVGEIQDDMRRRQRMHHMHVKLCATRHIEETLQKVIRRNRQMHFDWMQATVMGRYVKFATVWKLRKMFNANDERRAKNVLSRWFKIACDPVALIKVNKGIPELYEDSISKKYFFNKWKLLQFQKQAVKLNQKLKLHNMWYCLDRYWKRRMKVNYLCWRDVLIRKLDAIRTMYSFASKHRYFLATQAFMKWRNFKESQDFHARMHSLSISLAYSQLTQQLFSAWRAWAMEHKQKRQLIMRQAMKCLRVNAFRQRELKRLAVGAFSIKKQSQVSLIKQCYDALRNNAQTEKLKLAMGKLQTDVKPTVQALSFKIGNIQRKLDSDKMKRSTYCLAKLFGKLLSGYFHHWRSQSSHNTVIINSNIRHLITKMHKQRQQQAFNMWRAGRSLKVIEEQQFEFQEMQAGNFQLEEESRSLQRVIDQKVQASKNGASKKMSKLVAQAMMRHVDHYFKMWHRNVKGRNLKENKAELIVKRIYQKVMRTYWSKYRQGFETTVLEEKCNRRLVEIKTRLNFKTKRRMFNAILTFSSTHLKARNFLRGILRHKDKRDKQASFRAWKDFNLELITEEHVVEQAEHVTELHKIRQQVGQQGDVLKSIKDENKRLSKALTKTAEKTLQKWMQRNIHQSLRYFFVTWKGVSDDIGRARLKQLRVLRKINRIKNNMALRQWKLTQQGDDHAIISELISQEALENSCLQSSLNTKAMEQQMMRQQSKTKVSKETAEQEIAKRKNIEVVLKLIKLNDGNHFMSKKRAVFLNWREYINRRRQCCTLLSRAVFMMLAQRTFTEIRDFSRERQQSSQVKKASTCLFTSWNRCLLRKAYNKWRVTNYEQLKQQIKTSQELAGDNREEFEFKLARARGQFADTMSKRKSKQNMQIWYDAIRQYAFNRRELRLARAGLKNNFAVLEQRRCLQKWKQRKEVTFKMRKLCQFGKKLTARIYMRAVFLNWKTQFVNVKRFCSRVDQAMTMLANTQKETSFNLIRLFSHQRHFTMNKHKLECRKRLIQIFGHYNQTSMRRALRKFKENASRSTDALSRFKVILASSRNFDYKHYFMKWKEQARIMEVAEIHEMEDGPTRLECFKLRQQCHNLEQLLLKDGATPKQIAEWQDAYENRYKSFVEQSLCRLLCREDQDLQLLPVFIDRWRKFTRTRKYWKRALQQCNMRRDMSLSSKMWAFNKWKYAQTDRESQLTRMPFEQLKHQCVGNVEKLELMADALEATEARRQQLMEQRHELLRNQVGGQKLGLAVINGNYERAKQQAMARWDKENNAQLFNRVEGALVRNMEQIRALKDKILQIEAHNAMLAEQNDIYREGAMDGIMMAKHCDQLHRDRESLSVDLADKAITIRKLLEDNSYLHQKLQQFTMRSRRH